MAARRKFAREIGKLFRAKAERRKILAKLPIEEKIQILIRLQKIASEVSLTARGVRHRPWSIRG